MAKKRVTGILVRTNGSVEEVNFIPNLKSFGKLINGEAMVYKHNNAPLLIRDIAIIQNKINDISNDYHERFVLEEKSKCSLILNYGLFREMMFWGDVLIVGKSKKGYYDFTKESLESSIHCITDYEAKIPRLEEEVKHIDLTNTKVLTMNVAPYECFDEDENYSEERARELLAEKQG